MDRVCLVPRYPRDFSTNFFAPPDVRDSYDDMRICLSIGTCSFCGHTSLHDRLRCHCHHCDLDQDLEHYARREIAAHPHVLHVPCPQRGHAVFCVRREAWCVLVKDLTYSGYFLESSCH